MQNNKEEKIIGSINAGGQTLEIIEARPEQQKDALDKKYDYLAFVFGTVTMLHLIIDCFFYLPFIQRAFITSEGLLILIGVIGLCVSLTSYILTISALSKNISDLIRKGERNGYVLLICALINIGLLIITMFNHNSFLYIN
ncbi:MAG: hypothetical protein RL641_182 [Candidatus Parcubacteria bacterium]|jgi:hypothetical protein